jgi:uncharacterized membrane protein
MIPRDSSQEPWFAKLLLTITVLIHSYNFFTCFMYMGIEGFPEGVWLVVEILSEVFMVFEIVMQFTLRT